MSSVSQSPLFSYKFEFYLNYSLLFKQPFDSCLYLCLSPFQSVLLSSFISFKHLITTHGNCS